MIQVNELRIGNKLEYLTSEKELVEATVDWQDLKWISEDPKGFNLVHKPITLTEEILLKCGFVYDDEFGLFSLHPITLYKQDGIFWYGLLFDNIEIKYLHQLQNLYFALTGEELEIKL